MSFRIWFDKSVENLTVSEWCFENGHFNACANRMYYAMFHAGYAALLRNGITPPPEKIGHDWLQATFSRYLIHQRKVFPSKFRSYLHDAQAIRNIADYELHDVSKSVISRELKKAKEFLNAIHEAIAYET